MFREVGTSFLAIHQSLRSRTGISIRRTSVAADRTRVLECAARDLPAIGFYAAAGETLNQNE
jgi:hypothetical protein